MKHLLILLLLGAAISNSQDLITEDDALWKREYGYVTDVQFSPDGSRLVVTEPGAYYIYDSYSGEEIYKVYEPGSKAYLRTEFIDNNRVLTFRSYENELYPKGFYIHNIETNQITKLEDGKKELKLRQHFSINRTHNLLYLFNGELLDIWDLEENKFVGEFLQEAYGTGHVISKDDSKMLIIKGNKDTTWNLEIYDLTQDGLPKNRQILINSSKEITDDGEFEFDETGTKVVLPIMNKAAYYDIEKTSFVILPVSDYNRGGIIIDNYFFYNERKYKLKSINLETKEIFLKSELLGAYSLVSNDIFLMTSGAHVHVFNKSDLLSSTNVQIDEILPIEVTSTQIIVEPSYSLELDNLSGENYSGFIQNNKIDRSRLQNGTYFLTIQKGDYNKVFKFIEVK